MRYMGRRGKIVVGELLSAYHVTHVDGHSRLPFIVTVVACLTNARSSSASSAVGSIARWGCNRGSPSPTMDSIFKCGRCLRSISLVLRGVGVLCCWMRPRSSASSRISLSQVMLVAGAQHRLAAQTVAPVPVLIEQLHAGNGLIVVTGKQMSVIPYSS